MNSSKNVGRKKIDNNQFIGQIYGKKWKIVGIDCSKTTKKDVWCILENFQTKEVISLRKDNLKGFKGKKIFKSAKE